MSSNGFPSNSNSNSNSSSTSTTELVLAKWSDRFFAWLIDVVIVNAVLWALFAAAAVPFWITDGSPRGWFANPSGPAMWAVTSLVFLAYWIYFESTTGQSLGKMALRIKTTDLYGNRADIRNIAIESFGKAFLLPLDLVLGWLVTNEKRQRIFGRAGNTLVVKIKSESRGAESVRYTKE